MRYLTEINLAFANLYTHKLRTFLTMLGMIFGVGAVIASNSTTSASLSLTSTAFRLSSS